MKIREELKRWDLKYLLLFGVIAIFSFLAATYFSKDLAQVTYVILVIELIFIVVVTWTLAAHAVIKSLFGVSAGLSLLLYIAEKYCELPSIHRTANDALKSLIAFGLVYIGVEFVRSLYVEARDRSKTLKEINGRKWPWLLIIPFALFTGLFTWQVIQVLVPIVQNVCVYTGS